MRKVALMLGMCLLLISFVNANSIYRENGDIKLEITDTPPKLSKQTGFERNFYYAFEQVDATHWDVTVCHKNFAKNKNKTLSDGSDLNNYPMEVQDKKTKVKKADKPKLKLKNNKCDTFTTEILPNDLIKLGEESTEIVISEGNVVIVVTPEESECVDKACASEIIIVNSDTEDLVIESDDLFVSIEDSIFNSLAFWNGTDMTTNPSTITIEAGEEFIFYLTSIQENYGFWKYNVSFNYSGTVYEIDPYYNTTNTTAPRAEFNTADNQVILPSTIFNISGDALDYYNLSSFDYEIEKPDSSKTNFSVSIPTEYDFLRDEPDSQMVKDNFGSYVGDFTSVKTDMSKQMIKPQYVFTFNRIHMETNGFFGDYNVSNDNLKYDVLICPTAVVSLTSSTNASQDCSSTPILLGDATPTSEQNGISQFGQFEMFKLNNSFTVSAGQNYILIFNYSSGFVNDGENDFITIRMNSFSANTTWCRINNGAPFCSGIIPSARLSTDYAQSYSDTSAEGNYTVKIFAEDYHGNINDSEVINFRVCEHNWTAQFTVCTTNDTYIKTYIDSNNCPIGDPVPVDNGSTTACDYCVEDIEQIESMCFLENSTLYQNLTYIDNNYFSCCVISSLPSDCSILTSPYNKTTVQLCNVTLENDFAIELDLELFFGFGIGGLQSDKVHGNIWINDTNTTYYCLSYVKTSTSNNLVQSNPPYTKRTISTISIIPKEIEDREFFVTQNGLANIYWTDDNLVIDGRQYIFGVQCSGNNQLLKSEVLAQTFFDPVNRPITRWFWFSENIFPIVLGTILVAFLIGLIGLAWRSVRK